MLSDAMAAPVTDDAPDGGPTMSHEIVANELICFLQQKGNK